MALSVMAVMVSDGLTPGLAEIANIHIFLSENLIYARIIYVKLC